MTDAFADLISTSAQPATDQTNNAGDGSDPFSSLVSSSAAPPAAAQSDANDWWGNYWGPLKDNASAAYDAASANQKPDMPQTDPETLTGLMAGRTDFLNKIDAGTDPNADTQTKADAATAATRLAKIDQVLGAMGNVPDSPPQQSAPDMVQQLSHSKLMASTRYQQIYNATAGMGDEQTRQDYARDALAMEVQKVPYMSDSVLADITGAPKGSAFLNRYGHMIGSALPDQFLAEHGADVPEPSDMQPAGADTTPSQSWTDAIAKTIGIGVGSAEKGMANLNTVVAAIPAAPAVIYDKIVSAFGGDTTAAEDYVFKHLTQPADETAQSIAADVPEAHGVVNKTVAGLGEMAPGMLTAMLTKNPEAVAAAAPDVVSGLTAAFKSLYESAPAAMGFGAPSVLEGEQQAAERGAGVGATLEAGAAEGAQTAEMGLLPMSAGGKLMSRLAQGGAAMGAQSAAQQYADTGDVDPGTTAAAALTGAAFGGMHPEGLAPHADETPDTTPFRTSDELQQSVVQSGSKYGPRLQQALDDVGDDPANVARADYALAQVDTKAKTPLWAIGELRHIADTGEARDEPSFMAWATPKMEATSNAQADASSPVGEALGETPAAVEGEQASEQQAGADVGLAPIDEPAEVGADDLTPEEAAAFARQTAPQETSGENNASGESAASLEAQSRVAQEKAAGQHRMLIDRDGTVVPLVGVDAVDQHPGPGQVIVQRGIGDEPDAWTPIDLGAGVTRSSVEGRMNASAANLDAAVKEVESTDKAHTAGAAAMLDVDPGSEVPLSPQTPIDTTHSVPLGGGVSQDGGKIYIDKNIPQMVDVKGTPVDAWDVIAHAHEAPEQPQMEAGKEYEAAHNENANSYEAAYLKSKYGVSHDDFNAALEPYLAAARENGAGATDIPDDLDRTPYEDSGETHLLHPSPEPDAAHKQQEDALTDDFMQNIGDEIGWDTRGGYMIRGGEVSNNPEDGADFGRTQGDVVGRTSWVGKAGLDGTPDSNFWRLRPDKITEAQAHEALRKNAAGERLGKREQRFIDWAQKNARDYARAFMDEKSVTEQGDHAELMQRLRNEHGIAVAPEDEAEAATLVQLASRASAAGLGDLQVARAARETDPMYAARLWNDIRSQEERNGTQQESKGGDRQGDAERDQAGQPADAGAAAADQPESNAGQGAKGADLFAAPSAQELISGARREKDDERNGVNGTGRTDMMAGPGELFAGRRPEQADIEQPQAPPDVSLRRQQPDAVSVHASAPAEGTVVATRDGADGTPLDRLALDNAGMPSKKRAYLQEVPDGEPVPAGHGDANLHNVYDLDSDPRGLMMKARSELIKRGLPEDEGHLINEFERQVVANGFDGYRSEGHVAILGHDVPVGHAAEGAEDGNVQPAERGAPAEAEEDAGGNRAGDAGRGDEGSARAARDEAVHPAEENQADRENPPVHPEGAQPPREPRERQAVSGDGAQVPRLGVEDEEPEYTTGIKNAKVAEERAAKGKDELDYEGRRTFGDVWATARARLDESPEDGALLAQSIVDKPRPLSAEESAVLIQDRARLHNEHRAANADIVDAMDSGDETKEAMSRAKLRTVEDAMETNDEASRASGYEQGFGLAARRMMSRMDYTMAELATRAKVAAGRDLTVEERAKLSDMAKRIEEMDQKIAAMEKEKLGRARKWTPKALKGDAEFKSLSERLKAIRAKDQMTPGCAA